MSPYLSILIIFLFLFCCKIHGADAEGESLEFCLFETGFLQHLHHCFSLREGFDGGRQIVVGTLVFRDQLAVYRQYRVGIDAEELLHRESHGMCEFYDAQMSALLQYSAHFLESLVEVLEIAYAECCRHCIEGFVWEGEEIGKTKLIKTIHEIEKRIPNND